MSAVRIMLAAVRRVGAFRGLSFEAFGDLAMSLCIGLGLALLVLGSLATPDSPSLWAEVPDPGSSVGYGECPGQVCDTGCHWRTTMEVCQNNVANCGQTSPHKPLDCVYCLCAPDYERVYIELEDVTYYYCKCV
ncbi:MAG: hypothetical protein RMI91_15010 [Gemmatales bacterium]|nr:hypothetical protein [Gemmatales bacterium]